MSNHKTLIIDGNHLFVRAFEINEKKLMSGDSDATEYGAVYILLTSIRRRLLQFKSENVYITWDRPVFRGKHYRYELSNGLYKANRKPKSDKFYNLLDKCIELVRLLGIKTILPYKLEADDVIAFLSLISPKPCVIISGDNDLLQLLQIDGVCMYNIIKEKMVTKDNILDYYPVNPYKVVLYKAIIGDKGDNIEGIGGHGPVKAMRLCEDVNLISELPQEKQLKIELNKKLVSFGYSLKCEQHKNTEIPFIQKQLKDQESVKADFNEFFNKCTNYKFFNILKHRDGWMDLQRQDILRETILQALVEE